MNKLQNYDKVSFAQKNVWSILEYQSLQILLGINISLKMGPQKIWIDGYSIFYAYNDDVIISSTNF